MVAVIGLLISILLPGLSAARAQARGVKCLGQLRALGQGMSFYATENRDVMMPGRLPRLTGNCDWYADIYGGRKYRPTFLAMMSLQVGVPAFDDPQPCRGVNDAFGEPGDRQNYASPIFVCPEVPEWTDERNGSYGYNYQFLGNSRLKNTAIPDSFKNWPVQWTRVRYASRTVAIADCMGTAASFAPSAREPYENNSSGTGIEQKLGNEGFNLDPPRIDLTNGEAAGLDLSPPMRTGVDPRHRDKSSVLRVDGSGSAMTIKALGYRLKPDGSFDWDGDNTMWTPSGTDVPWTPDYRP